MTSEEKVYLTNRLWDEGFEVGREVGARVILEEMEKQAKLEQFAGIDDWKSVRRFVAKLIKSSRSQQIWTRRNKDVESAEIDLSTHWRK